jgi:hypothetical protein
VLGRPTRVRAYRVLSPFAPDLETLRKTRPLIDEHPILEEAPVPAATAAAVGAILLDPDTYDPSYGTDCNFDPRYALRFERGRDHVDVVICFKCEDLDVIPAPQLGEQRTIRPFGRAAKPLYDAVTALFAAEQPHRR